MPFTPSPPPLPPPSPLAGLGATPVAGLTLQSARALARTLYPRALRAGVFRSRTSVLVGWTTDGGGVYLWYDGDLSVEPDADDLDE